MTDRRSWKAKFADASRGIVVSIHGGSSFYVHLTVAALVVICGVALRVSRIEWCLLVICIALVLFAEMMNSALESMARAVDAQHNPDIGRALDMASGAVLVCAVGAAMVGLIVFVYRLLVLLSALS